MNIRYTLLTFIIFIHAFQCSASTLDRVIDTSKSMVNVQLTARWITLY
ncbi:secreted protein [Candidatus Magnetomorum sp. HK-1]|nr:secreted protein [Candidatus Magnetomorum sp. HK-1]